MADSQCGTSLFVADTQECESHALCAFLVKGRGGFVQQQQRFRQGEGCCEEEALALTARELGGIEREEGSVEPQGTQEGGHGRCVLGLSSRESEGGSGKERAIVLQIMSQAEEVGTRGSRRLEFLGDISYLTTNVSDVVDIQRQATNLDAATGQRHEAQYST